jgi:signal transduction histidine kinase
MNWYVLIPLIAAFTNILLGLGVFLSDVRNSIRRVFALFCSCVALWNFSCAMMYFLPQNGAAFWAQLLILPLVFIAPTFFHFVLTFIKGQSNFRKNLGIAGYAFGGGLLVISRISPIVLGVEHHYWGYYPQVSELTHLIDFQFFSLMIYGIYLLVKQYAHETSYVLRNQIKYLFTGVILALASSSTNFTPFIGIELYPIGHLGQIFYTVIIACTIIKYRLWDINVLVKVGILYITFLALFFLFLLSVVLAILSAFGEQMKVNDIFITGLMILIAFPTGYLGFSRVARWASQQILMGGKNRIASIEQLGNQVLSSTDQDMNNLVSKILNKLSEIMGVSGVSIFFLESKSKKYDIVYSRDYISDSERIASISSDSPLIDILLTQRKPIVKEELELKASFGSSEQSEKEKLLAAAAQLDEFGVAVCIPLFRRGMIGMFNFAPKRSGKVFFTEELNELAILGNQIAITLENAKLMEELRNKAEELTRSNRELEQFAYIASHDLQEPLRSVSGYLQLIERRYKNKLDADAEKFITHAVAAAMRMHTQINDLLAYSRVGTHSKLFEPTDCNFVVDQVVANLQAAIDKSGAVVTYNSLPTIMADASQMVQLFQNLISNAIKFRSDKPPEIHIGAERTNGEWLFSVRDNGIGIDPQYSERIFQVFQRLHDPTEYPGTGIGLAICKKIVERHGGRIWVESSQGKGSTFFFTIPGT